MRADYFSIIGYLSVLLWLAVPVLWVLHWRRRPRKWLCHIALMVAVAALLFAKVNSVAHVGRIQLDTTKQMEEWKAKQDAKLKEAESDRSEDVADIRFAEDSAGDYLDKAGMEESDLKYMDKLNEDVPAWKREKKTRAEVPADDTSLDAQIGAKEQTEGVEGAAVEKAAEDNPILMLEKDKDLANKLDGLNLKIIRLLIVLGLMIIVFDYLHRANSYREAYMPLPLPSAWVNGVFALAPVLKLSPPLQRTALDDLKKIVSRGDTFVYMTDKSGAAEAVPVSMARIAGRLGRLDVVRVDGAVDDRFVFESAWYGRSAFVVDSADRAIQMLGQFIALLTERKAARARVHQTVHLVWDMSMPLDEQWMDDFGKLMKATGMSLVVRAA